MEWLMRRAEQAHDVGLPRGQGRLPLRAPARPGAGSTTRSSARRGSRGRWSGAALDEARRASRAAAGPGRARDRRRRRWRRPRGGRRRREGPGAHARRAVAARADRRRAPRGSTRRWPRSARRTSTACGPAPLLRAAKAIWRREETVTLPALENEVDGRGRAEAAVGDRGRGRAQGGALGARVREGDPDDSRSEARMAEIQKRLQGATGESLEALLTEKTRLVRQMASL